MTTAIRSLPQNQGNRVLSPGMSNRFGKVSKLAASQRTLDDYLGPGDRRFFGSGYKRADQRLRDIEISVDEDGHGTIRARASVTYPTDWSRKGSSDQPPHLSSIDVLLITGEMAELYLTNALRLSPAARSRMRLRHVHIRAGQKPVDHELADFPVTATVGDLGDLPDSPGMRVSFIDCMVGALRVRCDIEHPGAERLRGRARPAPQRRRLLPDANGLGTTRPGTLRYDAVRNREPGRAPRGPRTPAHRVPGHETSGHQGPKRYRDAEELLGPATRRPFAAAHKMKSQVVDRLEIDVDGLRADGDCAVVMPKVVVEGLESGSYATVSVIDAFVVAIQLGQILLYELDRMDRSESHTLWMRQTTLEIGNPIPTSGRPSQNDCSSLVRAPDNLGFGKGSGHRRVSVTLEQPELLVAADGGTWRTGIIAASCDHMSIRCSVAHQLPESALLPKPR